MSTNVYCTSKASDFKKTHKMSQSCLDCVVRFKCQFHTFDRLIDHNAPSFAVFPTAPFQQVLSRAVTCDRLNLSLLPSCGFDTKL